MKNNKNSTTKIGKYILYGVAILMFYLLLTLLLKGGKYDEKDTIMGVFSTRDILIGVVVSAFLSIQNAIKRKKQ